MVQLLDGRSTELDTAEPTKHVGNKYGDGNQRERDDKQDYKEDDFSASACSSFFVIVSERCFVEHIEGV
jgi:hypothetical protein